jgi:hypothetical protein
MQSPPPPQSSNGRLRYVSVKITVLSLNILMQEFIILMF